MVAGARPNFIKLAPLIRAASQQPDIVFELVYAGCEDDPTLESALFDDLQIARPTVFLGVDSVSLNEITGRVMGAFDAYLTQSMPDVVIVVDDLASTMAAAIVTKKRGIRLAHLVAGTRSFDISMPKEVNRLVIDGLSDLLFTAGQGASTITSREGAEGSRVYMVGNILIDNLRYNRNRWRRPALMDSLGLQEGRYVLFTLNRWWHRCARVPAGPLRTVWAAARPSMPWLPCPTWSSDGWPRTPAASLPTAATWPRKPRSTVCRASRSTAIPSI